MPADRASESARFADSPDGAGRSTDAASGDADPRDASPGSAVRRLVAGTRFADVRWVAETGSTNADVMARARDGAPEGLVLVADHQRAGRGRRGRSWMAPPGASLLVSVLLRPRAHLAGTATMAVAVALAEAVEDVTGCAPRLKWPNDLVVSPPATAEPESESESEAPDEGDEGDEDGAGARQESTGGGTWGQRKLAGILAEADWPPGVTASGGWRAPSPHDRVALVVGVGLNVNWPSWPHRPSARAGGSGGGRPAAAKGPEEGSAAGAGGPGDATGPGPAAAGDVPAGAGGRGADGYPGDTRDAGDAGDAGDTIPAEVADVATALNHLVGRDVDRVQLLAAFLRRLDGHYGRLVAEPSATGPAVTELVGLWRSRSATLGRRVRVDLGSSDVEGIATDVTGEGHLVVATDDGERRTLAVGDVVHLRPARPR